MRLSCERWLPKRRPTPRLADPRMFALSASRSHLVGVVALPLGVYLPNLRLRVLPSSQLCWRPQLRPTAPGLHPPQAFAGALCGPLWALVPTCLVGAVARRAWRALPARAAPVCPLLLPLWVGCAVLALACCLKMLVDLFLYWWLKICPLGLAPIFRSAFALILLVGIRITTPRLKLETLSRLGWLAGFGMLLFAVIAYVCVWFML